MKMTILALNARRRVVLSGLERLRYCCKSAPLLNFSVRHVDERFVFARTKLVK